MDWTVKQTHDSSSLMTDVQHNLQAGPSMLRDFLLTQKHTQFAYL